MIKKIYWHYPHLRFWMGGSRFLYEVTSRINKKYKNLNVTIITNQINKKFLDKFKKDNVNVLLINKLACTNDFYYWLFFPIFFIYELIITFLKTKSADILIATLFPSNLITAIISKIQKKPYYFYCYEPFPFFHNKKLINKYPEPRRTVVKILAFLYGWLDIWASRQAKKIFTLNKITQEMTYKIYKKKSIITWMGVDYNFFKPIKKNNYFIKKYSNKLIISHSTDYTETKKTDLAILAISHLVKKYPNILLLITSTQPNNPNKKKYINLVNKLNLKENVIFLDLIDLKLLPHLYSASICYLSTSYDKMMGTSSSNLPVKEAMSCQTPCLRSSITNEDIEDGKTGFLINPKNIKDVVEKIDFLIKNKIRRDLMGVRARNFIKNQYTWDNVNKIIIKNL